MLQIADPTTGKPLMFQGQGVFVGIDGGMCHLYLSGRIDDSRPMTEIVTVGDAQDWAVAIIEMIREAEAVLLGLALDDA